MEEREKNKIDIRGRETTVCWCGSVLWRVNVIFDRDSKEIALFFLEMECALCGSIATTPIPEV